MFEPPRVWLDVFAATVATRGSDESTRELCRRAVLDVAELIEANRDVILVGMGVIETTPALQSRYGRTNRDWLECYLDLLSPDVDADNDTAVLQVAAVAGALVGGTDQALAYWVRHPDKSLVKMTEHVLEAVEPLWPDESRQG